MSSEDLPGPMKERLSKNRFLTRVYGTMALGLLLTFAAAWWVARYHPALLFQPMALILLVLAQLIVVICFSRRLMHASFGSVAAMFVGYCLLNGLTMSTIFLYFQISAIYPAFLGAAVAFGSMALYGSLTRRNLSVLREILLGGLIALLVLTLLGIFLGSGRLELLVCWLGILVFLGLTAYDAQKLLSMHAAMPEMGGKLALSGALQLYRDFLNLFQFILLLSGGRKRR